MNPPDSPNSWNLESQEIAIWVLHPDQLERAREMEFDPVRLARFIDIAKKSKSIKHSIESLDPRVYEEIKKLNDIVQKTVNEWWVIEYSFPSELSQIFEQSVTHLQEALASDENILSMSEYFAENHERGDVMGFILFCFHVWSRFPELRWWFNGENENGERAVEYVRLCDLYLGSYHTGDAMILVPSQTAKGIKTIVWSISTEKVKAQKDKSSLDSFAKFCIDPGADDEKNMKYLEYIILLGGWVADDFVDGKIPVKIRDLFIKKHLLALQEKWLLYEEFSKFFTSKHVLNKLIAASIEWLSSWPIKAPRVRSARKVAAQVQKAVISGMSNPTIPLRIDQISRSGFSIAWCPDGTTISLEISNGSDRSIIDRKVEGWRVSFTPESFDPLADYEVQAIITSEAPKQAKYAAIDRISLPSPIKEFVRSTAPKIRRRVENSIIRLGESTNVWEFIENFSWYEAYIGIGIRKVRTKDWKKYTMTDTINFGSIDPGNYELCFFILSDDLIDEAWKNHKISTFTRKLIIGSKVSTDDENPPPPPPPPSPPAEATNHDGLKSAGSPEPKKNELDPNEERILDIALVLEWRSSGKTISVTRNTDWLTYVFLIHPETENEITFTCDKKWRISDRFHDLMAIAWDDLSFYMDQCDLSIEEAETKRLSGKLSMTIAYLYTVFQKSLGSTFKEEQLLNLPELIGNYRMGNGYAWAAVFQPWAKQDLMNFQDQLRQSWIHSAITKPEGKIWYLEISISLNGEDHVSGKILTTDTAPYYTIILDPKCRTKIGEILKGILEKSYLIFGYLAWQKNMSASQPKWTPLSKRWSSDTDWTWVLTSYQRISNLIRSPLWDTHFDGDQSAEIEKVWESFRRGVGKVCSTIRSNALGYETYDIHGKRPITDITEPQNAHLLVVMKDESISSLPDGMKGNPYSFTRVEENPRLQKYLISRVIATLYEEQKVRAWAIKSKRIWEGMDLKIEANRKILNREIEVALEEEFGTILQNSDAQGKSPFSGTMNGGFILLWQWLDTEKQKEFLRLALASKSEALKFEIRNGETIIPTLLASWRKNGIEICYRRPQLMTAAELKHIKALYTPSEVESV